MTNNHDSNYSIKTNNKNKNSSCTYTAETKVDEKTTLTNEYFKQICEKFPNIKFNMTTDKIGSATQLTVNLSPKLVEKMLKDPKLAENIEKELTGEPAVFEWIKNMCKINGQELSTRYVIYDENGESVSSCELRSINKDSTNKIYKHIDNNIEKESL